MGPSRETKIRGEAFVTDGGQHVCFVEGVCGYVSIFHVTKPKPVEEDEA
jgi:hypothetical protein